MTNETIQVDQRIDGVLMRALRDFAKEERTNKRFQGRINNLRLFMDHSHPAGHALSKSVEEYRDHPLIQVLLRRRDRAATLEADLTRLRAILEDGGDQDIIVQISKTITRTEELLSAEYHAMEVTLVSCTKSCDARLTRLSSFAQKLMVLAAKIQSGAGGSEEWTDAELAE